MKTQLLEDIGQNATSSLTPSNTAGNSKEGKEAQHLAPAGKAQPTGAHPASGVWRQKASSEPSVSTMHAEEAAPPELDKVFEEIAALEAQFVAPGQQQGPALAPAGVRHEFPAPPAEPLHKPAIPPAGAMPAATPAHDAIAATAATAATAPQEPLFDFTPPPPGQQAADPFTPAATGRTRSRQRYLLLAACVLSGALLIQGGRWFYQERNDAEALALIAGEAKEAPRADQPVKQEAIAAQGAAPEAGAGVPVAPAMPASRPVPEVPPLVMLEPDPPAAAKGKPPSPSAAGQAAPPPAPQPEPAAELGSASPLPQPSSRTARAASGAASGAAADTPSGPAKESGKRAPVRQLARASATGKERPSARESSMAATLKACREHGYHATQCIKQDCSVTQYGLVCRGR